MHCIKGEWQSSRNTDENCFSMEQDVEFLDSESNYCLYRHRVDELGENEQRQDGIFFLLRFNPRTGKVDYLKGAVAYVNILTLECQSANFPTRHIVERLSLGLVGHCIRSS